ncbi:MAG: hypothetical protein ACK55I_03870, partial [bacterium]
LGCDLAREAHDRHLPLVLVAVVPAEAEDGGPRATGDDGDRHHHVRPAAEVVRVGHLEEALLLPRAVEIDRGVDHDGAPHASRSTGEATPVSVLPSRRMCFVSAPRRMRT